MTVRKHKRNFELVREKLVEVEEKDAIRNFKPPVDGALVMRVFNIQPCHAIGTIKEYIKNAILDDGVENSLQATLPLMLKKGEELGLTPTLTLEQLLDELN
jgi:poly(A) polymerase